MTTVHIRQAVLDDTQAISQLFRSRVSVWQRMNAQGQVEDRRYETLTIYERWLHGTRNDSAWMSVETGAIFLSRLLRGAGVALVAESDGCVLAYAEAYHGSEPPPFGEHLHLAHLVVHPEHQDAGLDDALMRHLLDQARVMMNCQRFMVSISGYDTQAAEFYARYGLQPLSRVQRFNLPAKTGQSFYRAVEHASTDPGQINGWFMSIGRLQSARQQWEMLWPRMWDAVPEIARRQTHRLRFSSAGHEAFLCCQQQLYNPRAADIYCWSPKILTPQLLTAVRDWSHREGYRTLVLAVTEDAVKVLGSEAEPDPYFQQVYSLDL